eukprot:NODE_186_length_2825_cov_44.540706_g169_i0.p1 GENE.NODE_186_length_2825_cov_44.540706_g169_i0~~NODE_186_length_2825_cov_44.540706_g169_i0.p1  ORF type:complete len:821 (+),score=136.77 NODE_186_length_2825_cov_44.540706_g169_i0:111-2465(+)
MKEEFAAGDGVGLPAHSVPSSNALLSPEVTATRTAAMVDASTSLVDQRDGNLEPSFHFMRHRALVRQTLGVYGRSVGDRVSTGVLFALVLGCATLSFSGPQKVGVVLDLTTFDSLRRILVAGIGAVLFLLSLTTKVLRCCLFWLLLALLTLMVSTGRPLLSLDLFGANCPHGSQPEGTVCSEPLHPCYIESSESCIADPSEPIRRWLMALWIALEGATVAIWALWNFLLPKLARQIHFGRVWWVQQHSTDGGDGVEGSDMTSADPVETPERPFTGNAVTAVPGCVGRGFTFRLTGKRVHCRYRGSIDFDGKPHGWGQWLEESEHGECLRGLWCHGRPVGPYESREFGSGDSFVCVCIGFASCRTEGWRSKGCFPAVGELRWGVADVECSTSGRFFRTFPLVTLREGPTLVAQTGMPAWRALLEGTRHLREQQQLPKSVVVTLEGAKSHLVVSEHVRVDQRVASGSLTIRVALDSSAERWRASFAPGARTPSEPPKSRGLVVDGWRLPGNGAPHEVLVFVPGYNASLESSLQRLGQLLGLARLPSNIKPICFSYPAGSALSYYSAQRVGMSDETANALEALVYGLVHSGVERVHILAHSMGARVLFAALGKLRNHFTLESDVLSTGHNDDQAKAQLATVALLNPDYSKNGFIEDVFPLLCQHCSRVTLYSDKRDGALLLSEYFNAQRTWGVLGFRLPARVDSLGRTKSLLSLSGSHLDMDVVDTSGAAGNVHSLRHSYFNINRELVDDLRELLVTGRRAADRPRLVRRSGNVYALMIAPPCVSSF